MSVLQPVSDSYETLGILICVHPLLMVIFSGRKKGGISTNSLQVKAIGELEREADRIHLSKTINHMD